jgi:type II secretory pathway predicted ATPase ExeA
MMSKDPNTPECAEPPPEDPMAMMQAWSKLRFLSRPWLRELHFHARPVMAGSYNIALVGDQGVGKTEALRRLCRELNGGSTWSLQAIPTHEPAFYMVAAPLRSTRTALDNILEQLRGGAPLTPSEKMTLSPSATIDRIVSELVARKIHLVVIDEAHLLDVPAVQAVRLIWDRARVRQHPFGFVFSGMPPLERLMKESGQDGQRVLRALVAGPLTRNEVQKHFVGFHPLLSLVKGATPAPDWKQFLHDLYQQTRGNLREIENLLVIANELALEGGEPLSLAALRAALERVR